MVTSRRVIPRGATDLRRKDLSRFCLITVFNPIDRLIAPHANAMKYVASRTAKRGARAIGRRLDVAAGKALQRESGTEQKE